jgi:nucleoid-associated protein YgaU
MFSIKRNARGFSKFKQAQGGICLPVTWEALADCNKLTNPHRLTPTQIISLPPKTIYIAQPGDNLFWISEKFVRAPNARPIHFMELAYFNGITNPGMIRPGQQIKLPRGAGYRVQHGDTLERIASWLISCQTGFAPSSMVF